MHRFLIVWLAAGVVTPVVADQTGSAIPFSSQQSEFFEKRVRPVLVEHCYPCHSAQSEKVKADFRLDSREGLLKGGETGPAIVPGDPDSSLLIKAVRYTNPDLQMPPKKGKLPQARIDDLIAWVRAGAAWPKESP